MGSRSATLAVWLACMLSTFWENSLFDTARDTAELLASGSIFATLHTFLYGGGALLLKRQMALSASFNLVTLVTRFLLIATVSSLILAASGLALIYSYDGVDSLIAWWIGDMTGVVVMTPIFAGIVTRLFPRYSFMPEINFYDRPKALSRFIWKLVLTGLLLSIILITAEWLNSEEIACFIFFLAIPVTWIVFTETPFRASISLAAVSVLTAAIVAVIGVDTQAYIYQFGINVIACSAYFTMCVPALAADNRALFEKVHIDYLTQALNREHFTALAEQQLKYAARYDKPVSLIVFDVDKFKVINDTYGHSVGDNVLREIAICVRKKLRKSDVFGRFGGDEFVLLLPRTNVHRARQVAATLRKNISQLSFAGFEFTATCSFGVAEATTGAPFEQAFDEADRALYDAKKAGRNRII